MIREAEARREPRSFTPIGAAVMGVIKAGLLFGFVSVVGILLFGVPSGGSKLPLVDLDFQGIHSALKTYADHAGQPPATEQGLEALVIEPRTSPKPQRWLQALKMLPADPWGMPYRYAIVDPKEREWRWELRCAGPDRLFSSHDDLTDEQEWGDFLKLKDNSENYHPSH
jgi:type II secretion system protein G